MKDAYQRLDRSVPELEGLAKHLDRAGTPVVLNIFPDAGHSIPAGDREAPINAFIDRWLLGR
jgi:dipeptidyl aminopeptidase/acylaminoacyl peptidase